MNADKQYLDLPMKEFLSDLASKTSAPGAGSLSAMVGAQAAALAQMVVEYSLGKAKTAAHESRLEQVMEEFKQTREALAALIKEDMVAFDRYLTARRGGDAKQIQRALAGAIAVPMEIIVMSGAIGARLNEIKAMINPYLLAEQQMAAILAYGAARSACAAVRANLVELADQKEKDRLEGQLDMLVGRTARHRNAVVHYQPQSA